MYPKWWLWRSDNRDFIPIADNQWSRDGTDSIRPQVAIAACKLSDLQWGSAPLLLRDS